MSKVQEAIAEANPNQAESNMSMSDFVNRRLGETVQVPVEDTPVVEEEPIASEIEEPEVTPTEESEESSGTDDGVEEGSEEDVLSQLSLEDMSEEELNELSQKLGSRAVARFGKLTARAKAAEEQLAAMQAKQSEAESDPLTKTKDVPNNPLAGVATVDELSVRADQAKEVIEWAEEILFESDGYAPDDVVTEVEGVDKTKSEVRQYLINARKTRDTFIPDQARKLQAVENGKQLTASFQELAKTELPWMAGEDNDIRKQYEAIISDRRIVALSESMPPDVKAQMPYLLAHAANSLYGSKKVAAKTGTTLRPPSPVNTGVGTADRRPTGNNKKMKNVSQRFRQSGTKEDFITLRTLQMSH